VSADTAHRFVIAYDIADDLRRTRVAKLLESYGDRIQYSVFIVEIKPARLLRLQAGLRRLIDRDTDSVLVCDLGPTAFGAQSRMSFIGIERVVTGQGPLFF
jgi:CRISPR-associated protein Cas2